jgi:uncharacterized protein
MAATTQYGSVIRTVEELESFGVPTPAVRDKVLGELQDLHREWIRATPLIFVATSSADGRCDVSPKGDPPGFIQILDSTTVAIPERVGNRRMDSFHNLLSNPHVGILCVLPGRADTLRINGRAELVRDAAFLEDMTVKQHTPVLALVIHIEEVFFHCPKALRRAKVWDSGTWGPQAVRPYAEAAMALWRKGEPRDSVLADYDETTYNERLYPASPPPS